MLLLFTLRVAGHSFASSDPDGGASRSGNPGDSLWPWGSFHRHGDPVLAGEQQARDGVMGALARVNAVELGIKRVFKETLQREL